MRKFLFLFLFSFTIILSSCNFATAQGSAFLKAKCPSPNANIFQTLTLQSNGNINAVPCPSGNFQVNGVTVAGGIGGNGTINTIPMFATATSLTNSFASQSATSFNIFNSASDGWFARFTRSGGAQGIQLSNLTQTNGFVANNSTVGLFSANSLTFLSGGITQFTTNGNTFLANTGVGAFFVGDTGSIGNSTTINLNDALQGVTIAGNAILLNSKNGTTLLGDANLAGNGTTLTLNDVSKNFTFSNDALNAQVEFTGINKFLIQRIITATGTTGNRTINLANGTVNVAAGSSNLTVTNNTVTVNSLIIATAQTNDATCSVKNVVASAGAFVINLTANCTSETKIAFWVTN